MQKSTKAENRQQGSEEISLADTLSHVPPQESLVQDDNSTQNNIGEAGK